MTESNENTPASVPLGRREYQIIVDKLDSLSSVCASITCNQIEMLGELRDLAEADRLLERRVATIELSQRWAPFILSALAVAVSAYNTIAIHTLGR